MSRGFVKEEDQEEAPFIPPRAALPPGVTNYVTPLGLELLHEEKRTLEAERAAVNTGNEAEDRRAKAFIDGKMKLLQERIASARVLHPRGQPIHTIRFGARVELLEEKTGKTQVFQIVGVDEANLKKQKLAFTAPLARAVNGKKVGEWVELNLGPLVRKFKILKISY